MAFNLYKTAKSGQFVPEQEAQAAPLTREGATGDLPWGHRWLEAKPLTFTVLAVVAVLVGGLVEVIPMWLIKQNVPTIASVKPYTPSKCSGGTFTSAKAASAATRR